MDAVAARRRSPTFLQHQQYNQYHHQHQAASSSFLPASAAMGGASGLNPNAPSFVPRAQRAVEEFPELWLRDFYAQKQQDQQIQMLLHGKEVLEQPTPVTAPAASSGEVDSDDVELPDADSLFHGYQPAEEEKRYTSTRNTTTTLSWSSLGLGGGGGFSSSSGVTAAAVDDWRYLDRAARAMNINASPWVMQHQM